MAENERPAGGLEGLEPRVRLMERAAELLVQTLFAVRSDIDAESVGLQDKSARDLATRVERLTQNVAFVQRQVVRIAAVLGAAPPVASASTRPASPADATPTGR
jgi:hypothetical protein